MEMMFFTEMGELGPNPKFGPFTLIAFNQYLFHVFFKYKIIFATTVCEVQVKQTAQLSNHWTCSCEIMPSSHT